MSKSERSWDSVARRYVEHDTTAQETFGPMRAVANAREEAEASMGTFKEALRLREERKLKEGATNDNEPLYRNTEDRDGFTEDGIVPVAIYGMPSAGGKVFPKPRRGDWMQTFSGGQFWPLDPRANEIHIVDIAHALSMQCRYAGHCRKFYSVAEHSVHLARFVSPKNALWALLHDASEAYLVDVPRPVKPDLTNYKYLEGKVMAEVCKRFGLSPEMPAEVHEADSAIIADERANMAPCVAPWVGYDKPLGVQLQFWPPGVAEIYFLDLFKRLTAEVRAAA